MKPITFLAAIQVICTGMPMAADAREACRLALLGVASQALTRVLIGRLRCERHMPIPAGLLAEPARRCRIKVPA